MIRYCIWDVGQVTYEYSLAPLHQWCSNNSRQTEKVQNRTESFSFADYMSGKQDFSTMCQNLCQFYDIEYQQKHEQEIYQALRDGVGSFIIETAEMRRKLWNLGIINGILTNGLPCLEDTLKGVDINHYFCFTSYNLGILKPDPQIFKEMLKQLHCSPSDVVFVDDKPQNVIAAQKLGIHGICFRREHLLEDFRTLPIPYL